MKRRTYVLPALCLVVALGVLSAANIKAQAPAPAGEAVSAAEAQPASTAALAEIAGVGPRKLALYGDDVLAVLAGQDGAPGPGKDSQ